MCSSQDDSKLCPPTGSCKSCSISGDWPPKGEKPRPLLDSDLGLEKVDAYVHCYWRLPRAWMDNERAPKTEKPEYVLAATNAPCSTSMVGRPGQVPAVDQTAAMLAEVATTPPPRGGKDDELRSGRVRGSSQRGDSTLYADLGLETDTIRCERDSAYEDSVSGRLSLRLPSVQYANVAKRRRVSVLWRPSRIPFMVGPPDGAAP
jgi:hypothetical protein